LPRLLHWSGSSSSNIYQIFAAWKLTKNPTSS